MNCKNGTVIWFNEIHGHGRIRSDDGRDLKVSYGSIAGEGYRSLEAGEKVSFEIIDSPRGQVALNVKTDDIDK
jgi:CspA family cold shock protein